METKTTIIDAFNAYFDTMTGRQINTFKTNVMTITTVKEKQIKELFEKETGIMKDEIQELIEAFPFSYTGHIQTLTRTFEFNFTYGGRAKKGSFKEEL